jgi:hypothetical protein
MRLIAAAVLPVIFSNLLGVGSFAFRDQFSPLPAHYNRIKPLILRPAKVDPVDVFSWTWETFFKTPARSQKNKRWCPCLIYFRNDAPDFHNTSLFHYSTLA